MDSSLNRITLTSSRKSLELLSISLLMGSSKSSESNCFWANFLEFLLRTFDRLSSTPAKDCGEAWLDY